MLEIRVIDGCRHRPEAAYGEHAAGIGERHLDHQFLGEGHVAQPLVQIEAHRILGELARQDRHALIDAIEGAGKLLVERDDQIADVALGLSQRAAPLQRKLDDKGCGDAQDQGGAHRQHPIATSSRRTKDRLLRRHRKWVYGFRDRHGACLMAACSSAM